MLQVTNHVKPVHKEICPACKVNNTTLTFKAQPAKDEFVKPETKKSIGVIDKIKEYFNVPKGLRKNPELKALAEKAIAGDGDAGKALLNTDKLKGYRLEEVKEYVVKNLLAGLIKEPSAKKAEAVVKMDLIPEITKDMVVAIGRIKDLNELPVRMKGLGWVSVMSEAQRTLDTNKKALEIVKKDLNPLSSTAKEDYMSALKDFLMTIDEDQNRNNTNNYAKFNAIDLMVEAGKTADEAYLLIDEILLCDEATNMVKIKAAQSLPVAVKNADLPPLDKAELESNVIKELKSVIKDNEGNKDLQLACFKAIEEINK